MTTLKNSFLLMLLLLVGVGQVQAQQKANEIRMKTGTETITDAVVYTFYDSGGGYIMEPEEDPNNDYNWVTWYQHDESYLLHFINPLPETKGIEITFNYLLINNDYLRFYEGDLVDENHLIVELTNNDYSTGYGSKKYTVISHGNMTISFQSDYHWRDAGWEAEVKLFNYSPQAPVALLEACANNVVLLPGSKALTGETKMYYTTDGNAPDLTDPLSNATLYTGPFHITETCTVKAVLFENEVASSVSEYQFNKLITPPNAPSIERIGNTNQIVITAPEVPEGQNDTYYVRYSTDGSDPRYSSLEHSHVDTIELTSPSTVRAVVRGTTCPDIFSPENSVTYSTIFVPSPIINLTGSGDTGSAEITCSLPGATIYYTLDGSNPTPSTTTSGESPINLSDIPAGTTIKAMAAHEGTGYESSGITTAIYIPGGDGNSGVFSSTVLLDDREDHSWSYYSDGNQPVHSLKPADVKITYYGYGENTMTSNSNAVDPELSAFDVTVLPNQVAVGHNTPGNQFIYLKTLEAANEDGSGDYPYTMIPNPFQKRPASNNIVVTNSTVYISGSAYGNSGVIRVTYIDENGRDQTWQRTNQTNQTDIITVKNGTTLTVFAQGRTGTGNNRQYSTITTRLNNAQGSIIAQVTCTSNNYQNGTSTSATVGTVSTDQYRGFYAWRVKSLSSGLSIQRANGNTVAAGGIINAGEEIKFSTSKEDGNEVQFEALWARAWVSTTTTASNLNANVTYERNFVVGATPSANMAVPVTYSSYYPDGSIGANAAVNGFTCQANTKFEDMAISGGTFTANNHDLIMGRGLTGTADMIQGINDNAQNGLNYTLRVESGTYTELSFVRSSNATVTGRYIVKSILGCDYDRAKKDNSLLSASAQAQLFYSQNVTFGTNTNKDQKTFDLVVKSGEYQKGYWDNQETAPSNNVGGGGYRNTFYCGQNSAGNTYPGMRFVTVEGGELGCMNGGRGVGGTDTSYATPEVVTFDLRIKGGVFHGSVYGGAADNPSIGSRRIVITGGEIHGWVAAGANGTGSTSGTSSTDGNSYVYVGGEAIIGGDHATATNTTNGGQVFGAGRGISGRASSVNISNVVIADQAQISNNNNSTATYITGGNGGNVYGGGNYGCVTEQSNVYILGGTIQNHVFGGAYGNGTDIPEANIYIKGGTVSGNVYGGSNSTGTVTLSNIAMSDGEVTNVFGGGLGANTIIGSNAVVQVSGGTIDNNCYGGGQLGSVNGNTLVTISGGKVQNVYGAGLGVEATAISNNANIAGTTKVVITGNAAVEVSVYGGGENGAVGNGGASGSVVDINGGNIAGNVFGGGNNGFTRGPVTVNMSGGTIEGSLYGGAFGKHGKVYVAGRRTVNMRGGTINKNLYGGSRNADDALSFNPGTFSSSTESATATVINFAGGYVHYHVFASGYFGNVFGSVYVFAGTNAILNAPYHVAPEGDYNQNYYAAHQALRIGASVWAGGDFGNYDGTKFGDPTISGRSYVNIDGESYDTESNNTTASSYMYIGGSVYGSGTSCDAGKLGRKIIVREYGKVINASIPTDALPYSSATRALFSIQRADSLVIDNSHIVFLGEGKVNSLVTTEKYSIHEFNTVRMVNGSSVFFNYPAEQMKKFGSYQCANVYAATPSYTKIPYNGVGATPNKIRVNNGAFVIIKYIDENNVERYGELEGFSYMMTDDENSTCAYARPKQSTDEGNIINPNYDNPEDGGFVSYDSSINTYDEAGGTVESGIQMPYENHTLVTRNGEEYFRIWRAGGIYCYREGVFVAQSNASEGYSTTDVIISLPAFKGTTGYYYRIKSFDNNTTIDYGTDVMTVNAACYGNTEASEWMYINGDNETASYVTGVGQDGCDQLHYIAENPNINFGLVAIPQGAMEGNENMLICETADPKLANSLWSNTHNEYNPKVTFRLTFNNNLTNTVEWSPIIIVFEQIGPNGEIVSEVKVALTVTTLTSIEQDFVTQAYAVMRGSGSVTDTYTAKIVLPSYVMHVSEVGEISKWTCTSVTWDGNDEYGTTYDNAFVTSNTQSEASYLTHNDRFAMTMATGLNFDNTSGWDFQESVTRDVYNWTDTDYVFGQTTARDPIAFDFTLLYDGSAPSFTGNRMLGTLTFKMHFTNYQNAEADNYEKDLNIKIEVWFLGDGVNYYIDGVNGNNLYSGKYPNAAKKTLSGIFNRSDYHAGDYIFIVNTVTADGSGTLSWNGKTFSEVTLYRYPGGHECLPETEEHQSHYEDYDIETNACFTGPLVVVEKNMEMTGIVLDGFYVESLKATGTAAGDVEGHTHTYVDPASPLVEIGPEGVLSVYGASRLVNNNNVTTDGGAVTIDDGGVLNIYDGSSITNNYVSNGHNGAGVYVNTNSKVQLSDMVTITDNKIGGPEGTDNNVYLSTYDSWVDIGTSDTEDAFTPLLESSVVGITKNNDWGAYWYAPVAWSDGGQQYLSNLIGKTILFDDQRRYELVSLNSTHLSEPTNYVYFVGTWVTEVTSMPEGFNPNAIDTPQELAWAISVATGYNNQTAASNTNFTLTGDIDMNANIWVPIGSSDHQYSGTFNGNGHVVTGLRSPMNQENMGMFGITNGATISDLVAQANFSGGNMLNIGAIIGTMNGGTLSNVEASGKLAGTNATANIGGLVGYAASGNIHSSFAIDTLTGGNTTVVGGLVGTNKANLYNSYSNITLGENNAATALGGLVGVNQGAIENCYVVLGEQTLPAFADDNQGTIRYCYSDQEDSYVGSGTDPVGSGYYDTTLDPHAYGYMYYDNTVNATNDYVVSSLSYSNNQIDKWPGLLSTLNQWVAAMGGDYSPWMRPTTKTINDDLPVLCFPKDNCFGTSDGKFLRYSSNIDSNGLDNLFATFSGKTADMFLYDDAVDVLTGNGDNMLYVNEHVTLLQKDSGSKEMADIKINTGVTFDNSCKTAVDYWGNTLNYDWHLFSTPIKNAPLGISYTGTAQNWWTANDEGQVSDVSGSYLPDGKDNMVHWDFYCYYEPEYHWINFKRNSSSHHHYDEPHDQISYTNETELIPGKGYMAAIDQDSYLSNHGSNNNKDVTITLTCSGTLPETEDPTKDWGSNLIGNPFQAYLDLNLLAEGTGFHNFYIYEAESGNYVPFTYTASSNPVTPSQYIHPHQGFFVLSDATEEDFVIKYSYATNKTDEGSYFRGERKNYPVVNLFATDNAGHRDLAIIELDRPEIGGAFKVNALRNANFTLSAHLGDHNYGLLFAPEGADRIPVHFNTREDGTFTLTWSHYNGDFNGLYLVDNKTGVRTDMLHNDSYTFNASTDDYASRFYITYRVTGVDDNIFDEGNEFAYFDGNEWIINGQGQLDIIDLTGRILQSQYLGSETNRLQLNNVAAGVYVLRITNSLATKSQKIVIRK